MKKTTTEDTKRTKEKEEAGNMLVKPVDGRSAVQDLSLGRHSRWEPFVLFVSFVVHFLFRLRKSPRVALPWILPNSEFFSPGTDFLRRVPSSKYGQ